MVAKHALTIIAYSAGSSSRINGILENGENVVPSVERQHWTFLSQHLIGAGGFRIVVGIAVAQEAMVTGQQHLVVVIETAEEVEALEVIVVSTCHEVLDNPAMLTFGTLVDKLFLDGIVNVGNT